MELIIDGKTCDLGSTKILLPAFDALRLKSTTEAKKGQSMTLTIPATPRNDHALFHARDPHAAQKFNLSQHTAEISEEGIVLIRGRMILTASTKESYTIQIAKDRCQWAVEAAQRMFNTLKIAAGQTLNDDSIFRSWTNTAPVKFFPIHRDEYPPQNNPHDLLPSEKILTVDDYHPFIHLATVMKTIFEMSGYKIKSKFFDSEFFQSLYMSGSYSAHDARATDERIGFFARRLAPITVSTSYNGRVYCDPKSPTNSIGNIVECATPLTQDCDGVALTDLRNSGNCFSIEDGYIKFAPSVEVSTAFEYYIKYTTQHRILTRNRLRGIDTIYFGPHTEIRFNLTNRYIDRRSSLSPHHSYRIIVFDHQDNDRYRITATINQQPSSPWHDFASRSALLTSPPTGSISDPHLYIFRNNTWAEYAGDWAIYDGYIKEMGETTVEFRVTTPSEKLSPQHPKLFDTIYFSGAEPNMKFTLHKESSLKPQFSNLPGYGANIRFRDIAQLRIKHLDVVQSVIHLFNLRFFTHEESHSVYIEPEPQFYDSGYIADWTHKTDFSQPILCKQTAPLVHAQQIIRYRDGTGKVSRWDTQHESPFGAWTYATPSQAAIPSPITHYNPIFQPSFNVPSENFNAPSASILQIGDRDSFNFIDQNTSPRLVRYLGMHPLPEGERWGNHPQSTNAYPLAAFHFTGDTHAKGFTLCFEDRDSLRGLNRYYQNQCAREGTMEQITLSLKIENWEYEQLFEPIENAPTFRSIFRLDTGQGIVHAILIHTDAYSPQEGRLRCTFQRIFQD